MDTNDLKTYRQMALDRLEQLLIELPEVPDAADYFVDSQIRRFSKLPDRPNGDPPYVGLYGAGSTLDQYRDVATDRLQELIESLPQLDVVDAEVDKYIRLLSDLPSRPEGVQPYVNLFVIPTPEDAQVEVQVSPALVQTEYITTEQLVQIAGSQEFKSRLQAFTPGINATFDKYHINTKLRISHFLAQVMHESGGFRWLREIWGPTVAQQGYEGRRDLGNTQPGDGKRFMGRGLIQLTGRANYQQFTNELGKELGVDFVANPQLVEQAPYAVMVAGWYGHSRNINALADQDDHRRVTRAVNGGTNGIEDRRKYLQRAKVVLKNSQFRALGFRSSNVTLSGPPQNLYDFCKANLEYNPEAIAEDLAIAKHVQEQLVRFGLLDPPADGKFGPISLGALIEFQEIMEGTIPDISEEKGFLGVATAKALVETPSLPEPDLSQLGNDLPSRIIKYMQQKGYAFTVKLDEYNIVYIEGMEANGTLNDDQANYFNDLRLVIQFHNGRPKIVGSWEATTEPGHRYTYSPMNNKGAARIKFGQYKAWQVGTHGNSEPHEALCQRREVTVHRDFNKDMQRTNDKLDTGLFGINQHWGYDMPRNNIGSASAGCLVGRTRQGHREFMQMIKKDRRYQQNNSYMFVATIIPGDELVQLFPAS